jgi:uncharacterized membrane protein YfcA
VPVLAMLFAAGELPAELIMHVAIGTSLATIVITSISSTYAHHRHGAVQWRIFWRLSPGIVLGAWFGAAIADVLPTRTLQIVFGVFELAVAAQMAFSILPGARRDLPAATGLGLAGGVIGAVSAVVGIGGGTLTVPFLLWSSVGMRQAVATSAACGLPIALAGATGFMLAGWRHPGLPQWSTGYVYWPAFAGIVTASMLFAPLGARLAHRLPTSVLKKVFAVFLLLLGVRMLWLSV